jgi:hypothetical protein
LAIQRIARPSASTNRGNPTISIAMSPIRAAMSAFEGDRSVPGGKLPERAHKLASAYGSTCVVRDAHQGNHDLPNTSSACTFQNSCPLCINSIAAAHKMAAKIQTRKRPMRQFTLICTLPQSPGFGIGYRQPWDVRWASYGCHWWRGRSGDQV